MHTIRPARIIGSILSGALLVFDSLRWLLEWPWIRRSLEMANLGQAIDFAQQHWEHPGWLANPPVQILIILIGLALIYLDTKRLMPSFKVSDRQMILGGLAIILVGVIIAGIGLWQSPTKAASEDDSIKQAQQPPPPTSTVTAIVSAPIPVVPSRHPYLKADAEVLVPALRQMRDVLNESVRDATNMAGFFQWYDENRRSRPSPPGAPPPPGIKDEAATIQEQLKKVQDFHQKVAADLSEIMRKTGSSYQADLMPFVQAANSSAEPLAEYMRYLNIIAKLNNEDAGPARGVISDYNRKTVQWIRDQYRAREADLHQLDAKIKEIQESQ